MTVPFPKVPHKKEQTMSLYVSSLIFKYTNFMLWLVYAENQKINHSENFCRKLKDIKS